MNTIRITDGLGLNVDLLDYGARIVNIEFDGKQLACHYRAISDYKHDPFYLGASIGPITNRIQNATLTIENDTFTLPANEGKHCLHSGGRGFDQCVWTLTEHDDHQARFALAYDLSQIGMRGELHVDALYRVDQGALHIEYHCYTDTTTFINLTNHVYLNLSGGQHLVHDHQFEFFADSYMEVNQESIPTGQRCSIVSPFNDIRQCHDHHLNTPKDNIGVAPIAHISSTTSGIHLEILSDSPGFQFYDGEFLAAPFEPFQGFCVETQLPPDAINQPNFEAPLLYKDHTRQQRTVLQFSLKK